MIRRSEKDISGCAVVGIMNEEGNRFSGDTIMEAITTMRERSNGLGGGFAGYGIYPDFPEHYAFHLLYDNSRARETIEQYLEQYFVIAKSETIPVRLSKEIVNVPGLWRYFVKPRQEWKTRQPKSSEDDLVVQATMYINGNIEGAFVISSGKNMGIFKAVGFPEEVGKFYRLEEYDAFIWTAHGRFPTNSVGWWGGAHPFGLLDWSVVHNGEISSYGINKRYLLNFDYNCTLFTDTEVVTYLFDLLVRKHKLAFPTVAQILAANFWHDIARLNKEKKELAEALRITYGSALLNGPFSVIVGCNGGMVGINDRIKLRPLVAARKDEWLYLASEEAGIRAVCASPDEVWSPRAGEPVIGKLRYRETELV